MAPALGTAPLCCFQGENGTLLDQNPQTNLKPSKKILKKKAQSVQKAEPHLTEACLLSWDCGGRPRWKSPLGTGLAASCQHLPPSPVTAAHPACRNARGRGSIERSRPLASPPARRCRHSVWPGSGPGPAPSLSRTPCPPAAPRSS